MECKYFKTCKTEDIDKHICSQFERCEIYKLNEMFRNPYSQLGVKKEYTPVEKIFGRKE